jgi:hypothetical protein
VVATHTICFAEPLAVLLTWHWLCEVCGQHSKQLLQLAAGWSGVGGCAVGLGGLCWEMGCRVQQQAGGKQPRQ